MVMKSQLSGASEIYSFAMRLGVKLRQAYFLDIDPTMSQLDFSCQHLY